MIYKSMIEEVLNMQEFKDTQEITQMWWSTRWRRRPNNVHTGGVVSC